MLVRDAMSTVILTIGPVHTLRQAARLMAARRVGAAVVLDTDTSGLGILTERDILKSIGADQNPDHETAGSHTTHDVVFAADATRILDVSCGLFLTDGDTVGIRGLVGRSAGNAPARFERRSITLLRMTRF